MKTTRPRIDVNLDELDRVLDGARQAPLSKDDYEKLKDALHALAAMLVRPRNTEKTSAVLEKMEGAETGAETQPESNASPSPGLSGDRRVHEKNDLLWTKKSNDKEARVRVMLRPAG